MVIHVNQLMIIPNLADFRLQQSTSTTDFNNQWNFTKIRTLVRFDHRLTINEMVFHANQSAIIPNLTDFQLQ